MFMNTIYTIYIKQYDKLLDSREDFLIEFRLSLHTRLVIFNIKKCSSVST